MTPRAIKSADRLGHNLSPINRVNRDKSEMLCEDGQGFVLRAVIDNDDLKAGIRETQDGVDAVFNGRRFVVRGRQYADTRGRATSQDPPATCPPYLTRVLEHLPGGAQQQECIKTIDKEKIDKDCPFQADQNEGRKL